MYHKEMGGNTHRSNSDSGLPVSTLVSGVYIIENWCHYIKMENSLVYPIRLHSKGGAAMVLFKSHCMNMYTHTHH